MFSEPAACVVIAGDREQFPCTYYVDLAQGCLFSFILPELKRLIHVIYNICGIFMLWGEMDLLQNFALSFFSEVRIKHRFLN